MVPFGRITIQERCIWISKIKVGSGVRDDTEVESLKKVGNYCAYRAIIEVAVVVGETNVSRN